MHCAAVTKGEQNTKMDWHDLLTFEAEAAVFAAAIAALEAASAAAAAALEAPAADKAASTALS